MFTQTSFTEFQKIAAVQSTVPVFLEMAGDNVTPVSVFQALDDEAQGASLLESSEKELSQSRYSFIGLHPIAQSEQENVNNLEALKAFYKAHHCPVEHPLHGFLGGVVGFLSYDVVKQFEVLPDQHPNRHQIPDFAFTVYKTNITFDHHQNKVVILTLVEATGDLESVYQQAMTELQRLQKKVQNVSETVHTKAVASDETYAVDVDDATFMQMVEQAKQYIIDGDIFQVVLSREFQQPLSAAPFQVYRALRMESPAPYLFYLDRGDYVITGASPEKLITVNNNQISTCPLAGTRPRGKNAAEDQALASELLSDAKENAEHVMLVDLSRNDLGSTCEAGSVKVAQFKQVKHFSHVMHISSEVVGQLKPGFDAFDALKQAFPAGTLSGAPKIRAMEIIDELEHSRRGIYGGAICFIDANGDLNSCITIRTAFIKDGIAAVRAGAGIVYDSDAAKEAMETRHKAESVLKSIALAEGGLV